MKPFAILQWKTAINSKDALKTFTDYEIMFRPTSKARLIDSRSNTLKLDLLEVLDDLSAVNVFNPKFSN